MADFEGRGHSKMQGTGMGPGEVLAAKKKVIAFQQDETHIHII